MTDRLEIISNHVRELTERSTHLERLPEPIPYQTADGTMRKKRIHPSQHLSLLDQLRRAAYDRAQTETEAADRDARTVPHSDDDAMDRLNTIRQQVAAWLVEFGIEPRHPQYAATINRAATETLRLFANLAQAPAEVIRAAALLRAAADVVHRQFDLDLPALVGAAAVCTDRDLADRLAADLGRWCTWCRIMAGWDSPPFRPHVRCMNCNDLPGDQAGLRIRWALRAAVCLSCDTTWSDDGPVPISVLAEYIRDNAGASGLTAEQVAALVDPAKRSPSANRGGRS